MYLTHRHTRTHLVKNGRIKSPEIIGNGLSLVFHEVLCCLVQSKHKFYFDAWLQNFLSVSFEMIISDQKIRSDSFQPHTDASNMTNRHPEDKIKMQITFWKTNKSFFRSISNPRAVILYSHSPIIFPPSLNPFFQFSLNFPLSEISQPHSGPKGQHIV